MKKHITFACILALLLAACQKPDPGVDPNGNQTTDTTETIVKKYLVKQLLNDDPERVMLDIEWNDDCTKILTVKYGLGYGEIIDYDFKYYGDDSIRVKWSVAEEFTLWSFWYDSIMIHLQDERIDSICCYANGELSDIEHYRYNEEGKLVEREYFGGVFDTFEWNGEDAIECKMYGYYEAIRYDSFTNIIHPQYTLPFYLSTEVAFEIRQPLFNPVWKHLPLLPNYNKYESDADGYLTKMTHINSSDSLERNVTFYYRTPVQY